MRSLFIDEEPAPAGGLPALELRIDFQGGSVGLEATNAGLWGRLTDLCVELPAADRTGDLVAAEGVREPGLSMAVLGHVASRHRPLVFDAGVWGPAQGPQLPGPAEADLVVPARPDHASWRAHTGGLVVRCRPRLGRVVLDRVRHCGSSSGSGVAAGFRGTGAAGVPATPTERAHHGRVDHDRRARRGIATMNVAFYQAVDLIPLGIAATLLYLGPFALAVAHTKVGWHLTIPALALAGVAMVSRPAKDADTVGICLALVAARTRGLHAGVPAAGSRRRPRPTRPRRHRVRPTPEPALHRECSGGAAIAMARARDLRRGRGRPRILM